MTQQLPSDLRHADEHRAATSFQMLTALAAWALSLLGLIIIAANPGVPSLGYALFWLAVMAVGRAIALAIPWVAVAIDLALVLACLIGLEIGGLILVPGLLAFAAADALGGRDRKSSPMTHDIDRP
jgi:hypothetical protein